MAENRGKTLYCGIDQSDTFSKAETWAAGKDRNERDDTVYFGERGSFRGFIAAQEGWLTDGESGVTGVSIDRIFEFPREERRRVKRVKRLNISSQSDMTVKESCYNAATNPGDLLCSARGSVEGETGKDDAENRARNNQLDSFGTANWGSGTERINWETHRVDDWQALADQVTGAACRARGYRLARATFGQGHNARGGDATWRPGDNLGWFYTENSWSGQGSGHAYQAWQSRTWTATCKKTIRRTRK